MAATAPLPFDPATVRHHIDQGDRHIAITGPFDALGRCSFTLYWWDDYFPGHPDDERVPRWRGQCYFADPGPFMRRER